MAGSKHVIMLSLAAKYVWLTPPEKVLAEDTPRLVASVMELGTWEDATQLFEIIGPESFLEVLACPPVGTISDRSLAFWHYRLGRPGAPPKSRRIFE